MRFSEREGGLPQSASQTYKVGDGGSSGSDSPLAPPPLNGLSRKSQILPSQPLRIDGAAVLGSYFSALPLPAPLPDPFACS